MNLMRPFVMLIALLALLLAIAPGSQAVAMGMGADMAMSSAQGDSDGCASAMTGHDRTDKQHAGDCGKLHCCLGAVCVFVGLPAMTTGAMQVPTEALRLPAATAAMTGRDVAPPLDPPRPFV
jgi:hypothetical protein